MLERTTVQRSNSRLALLAVVMGLVAGLTVGVAAGSIMAIRTVARNLIGLTLDSVVIGLYLGAIYGAVWAVVGLGAGVVVGVAVWLRKLSNLRVAYAGCFGSVLGLYVFLTGMRLYNEDLYFYRYSFIDSLAAMQIFFIVRTVLILVIAIGAGYAGYRLMRRSLRIGLVCLAVAIAIGALVSGFRSQPVEQVTTTRLPSVESQNATPRIVLLGWDGATWVIIDRLIDEGKMPNLSRLIKNGARADLKTLPHTVSPEIWTTIYTGKSKAQHGICGFDYYLIPGLRRAVVPPERGLGIARLIAFALKHRWIDSVVANRSLRRSTPIWRIMNLVGRSAGVVGALVTWPAEEVEPILITNIAGDVATRIRRGVVGPEALSKEQVYYPEDLDEAAVEMILNEKRWELATGIYLYRKYRPYFFTCYTNQPDGVQHLYWKWMEPQYYSGVTAEDIERYGNVIENEYVFLDSVLGEFMSVAGDTTTVLIVSDHGFSPTYRSLQQAGHYYGPDGIFIAYGPPIRTGIVADNVSVFDVTPTILALAGMPVAEDMEGRVLEEIIRPEFLAAHPVVKTATYETQRASGVVRKPGVEKEIRKRLKALGYIAH